MTSVQRIAFASTCPKMQRRGRKQPRRQGSPTQGIHFFTKASIIPVSTANTQWQWVKQCKGIQYFLHKRRRTSVEVYQCSWVFHLHSNLRSSSFPWCHRLSVVRPLTWAHPSVRARPQIQTCLCQTPFVKRTKMNSENSLTGMPPKLVRLLFLLLREVDSFTSPLSGTSQFWHSGGCSTSLNNGPFQPTHWTETFVRGLRENSVLPYQNHAWIDAWGLGPRAIVWKAERWETNL